MNILGNSHSTSANKTNVDGSRSTQRKSIMLEADSERSSSETVSLLKQRGGGGGVPSKNNDGDKDADIECSNRNITSPMMSSPSSSKNSFWNEISVSVSNTTSIVLSFDQIVYFALFFMNIMSWYFTNGMNGISMQSYSATLHKDGALSYDDLSLTSVVTFLQLLVGASIGIGLLFLLSTVQKNNSKASPQVFLAKITSYSSAELFLSSLHGIGSLATNLGFVYGSASLVQILKLIEPFETLLLTKLCSAEESKMLSISIISSMTTVTMAAIALVQQRKSTPHPAAIFFALCSGFALSSRNVFQRRWHAKQQSKPSETAENNNTAKTVESGSANKGTTPDAKASTSDSSSSSKSAEQTARLQQSLVSFTQLSLQSGVMLAIMTMIQLILSGNVFRVLAGFTIFNTSSPLVFISWKVFLWHPLYNIFSMITLGFCSALTHSLLNAGKRVVAIIMAIFWFHEPFSYRTVVTLSVIAIGGSWYVMAVSQKSSKNSSTSLLQNKIVQPTLCLMLLSIVYFEPLLKTVMGSA